MVTLKDPLFEFEGNKSALKKYILYEFKDVQLPER